jgi:hypothetical protein
LALTVKTTPGSLVRQFSPIEPEFLAGTAHVSGIEVLARPAERNLRLPPFAMDRHEYVTFPALMLMVIEPAAAFGQPLSKSLALH